MRHLSYAEAISEATVQCMAADPSVIVMGIGVADYKGIFGTTVAAATRFPERVIEMPASENAMTGIALGAALSGKRPLVVHARHDFTYLTMDQLFNSVAKWNYTYPSGRPVPLVVRAIIGRGWGQGPTHSQSLQALYAHIPGLYVGMPSCAGDAKGMLCTALQGQTPTVLLEHRSLYSGVEEVPDGVYTVKVGSARMCRRGTEVTIVAVSGMVPEALAAADLLAAEHINADVIDLRYVRPLDEMTVLQSVAKTGRLVCVDTGWLNCSVASEISALVAEKGFSSLRAPVKRLGTADCPCPVSNPLEDAFYPNAKTIALACCATLGRTMCFDGVWQQPNDVFRGPY